VAVNTTARAAGRREPDAQEPGIKHIDEDLKLNKALWHMAETLRTTESN
jgi:hypothetical protein